MRFTDGGMAIAHPSVALRVNNGDAMRDAAEAGLGLALLPTFIVSAAIAAGRLIPCDIGAEAETDTVQLVYPKSRGVPNKVKLLTAHLRAHFGVPPYWDRVAKPEAGGS